METQIKITQNGPYIVSGGVPLYKKSLVVKDGVMTLQNDGKIPTPEGRYYLCRCGKSENAPFCDGNHETFPFDGQETADMRPFAERARMMRGEAVGLLDDNRCAFARLCHRQHGDVWELTKYSSDPEYKKEAVEGASQCIAGRLVSVLKDGTMLEDELEPSISIVQDPQRHVSAGLYVTGGIVLESADGKQYEVRNRMALCRCGESDNKPFCDANHVGAGYHDRMK